MEIRRSIAALVAAAPFCLCANFAGAQTITFGDSLQGGPIAAGYAGFQWGTGANQAINFVSDVSNPFFLLLTSPAADVLEFTRTTLFDLNSIDYQILVSGETALDSFDNYSTVVSGYRGTTLVKSVTENYPGFGGALFTGLNIDGVNKITISTTDTTGFLDPNSGKPIVAGSFTSPGAFVDQIKVSNFQAAPEIDPASALTALTLLLGSLAVLRGRSLAGQLPMANARHSTSAVSLQSS
jgi:hypothetical protein